ncbi:MAG: hypothetical protein K2G37_02130 [Clostridia bacterium]|nr:hypothetical protein [Clostridia bacterium]MDE7329342.1 hypothetical protein [Clostridia bacterium]
MKRAKLILILTIIAVAFCVCFAACSKVENDVKTEDGVVSRFGDGIVVLDSQSAPTGAVEYLDEPRVRAKLNVDSRLSGYHITGLYLPAGETLTIDVTTTRAEYGYSVVVNNIASGEKIIKQITTARTLVDAPSGGVVEIIVPEITASQATASNSFNMRIEGGIVMPYYRLGRDSLNQIEIGGGNYAVIDCVDARFYIPQDVLYDSEGACVIKDDLYDSLLWWESALSFLNETLGIPSNSVEYNSAVIFGNFGTRMKYDADKMSVLVDKYYFDSVLKYENLLQGAAWDLLYAICEHKVSISDNFSQAASDTMIVDILCSIDSVIMTQLSDVEDGEWQWLVNPYTCLKRTMELLEIPLPERAATYEIDVMRAFFINIMHSFGLEKTINIITAYGKLVASGPPSNDTIALMISEELDADVSLYCEAFGRKLSQQAKTAMSGNAMYIPVQTRFTVSNTDSYNMGYTVPMGEKSVFDFENNIVSMDDGWDIVSVDGNSSLWSVVDGVYYYTPSANRLTDEFRIQLRNGEVRTTLYGKLNVLITVATYKVYDNWTFDNTTTALDEAISAYSKRTPDYVGSTEFAGVEIDTEVDPKVYVLTVTEGCIKVPQTGKYRIYLRNHGLCRVEFGVSQYMMSMFNSPIPVQEFTRYQSALLDLDENKIYDFKMYLLSPKGEADAALGIKFIEDEENDDNDLDIDVIDMNYLIYKGLDKDDILKFVPPIMYPAGYATKEAFYQTYKLQTTNFISYPKSVVGKGIDLAFDTITATSSFYSAAQLTNSYEFVLGFEEAIRLEYVMLNVRSETYGAKVSIIASNTEYFAEQTALTLSDNTLDSGDNYMMFASCIYKYFKIIVYSDENFYCNINDMKLGQYFEESTIVPNTSSMLSYMGGWTDVGEYVSINGSISQSVNNSSIYAFSAICRQICIYGVMDSIYGSMDVYVDGKYHSTVDLESDSTLTDQLLFAIDFDTNAEHSVKVMPASKDDIINLDYISYIPAQEEQMKSISGVLYYALIIPAVIIVLLLIAAIADYSAKKKYGTKKRPKIK